ncbi:MAG: DM13 domain-containing protein [Thaumarchaeota archaeon]|nr:MAG: DM13 domain-containing protein [Nitrososphaerota archaeon]
MLRGVVIAIIIGAAIVGLYYIGVLQLGKKTIEEELPKALDQIQSGLTYDKFVNMVDSQREALVQKMPQKTIGLILEEARKFPTTVSESIQDMASKIGAGSQSIIYSKQGSFVGLNGNDAKGKAIIISVGKVAFLRFQDFEVTNGPDLHVFMTNGGDIATGIDLGKLKGSVGDQNYALNGVDLKTYDTVVIYCKPFHINFAEAKLS